MKKVVAAVLLVSALVVSAIGCATPNPVTGILIFKAYPGQVPPPVVLAGPNDPHPKEVQMTFSPGDHMFLILRISKDLPNDVTFSRYTLFDLETAQGVEIGSAADFRTWEPGQVDLLAFNDPWLVPERPGRYQVRIYLDQRNVASAVFRVQ